MTPVRRDVWSKKGDDWGADKPSFCTERRVNIGVDCNALVLGLLGGFKREEGRYIR